MVRKRGLLSKIERGAVDRRSNLSDVLRMCVVLGGYAGSTELRDWARRELDGYRGEVELPSYRKLDAPLLADGFQPGAYFQRRQLSVFDLPKFSQESMREGLTLPFGVAELERLAAAGKTADLQPAGADDLVYYMNRSGDYTYQFERIYYSASPIAVHGVLDQIRTKLVALAGELRANGVDSAGVPSKAATDAAVKVVVKGFARPNIAVGENASVTTSTTRNSSPPDLALSAWLRGPWAFILGVSTIVGGIAAASSVGWLPWGN